MDTSYWQKQEATPLFPDILWNKPEQRAKAGNLAIIGGNLQIFFAPALATATAENLKLNGIRTILPKSLEGKLPKNPYVIFAPSTDSGSFSSSAEEILNAVNDWADQLLIVGDLSKNAETTQVLEKILENSEKPALITRDAVDLVINSAEDLIERPLTLFLTLPQLQSLLKNLFYPRPLFLTQPFLQILETIHKFTLTYPNLTIITFAHGYYLVAKDGKITTTKLENTPYNPISLWSGELATKISAYQIWNPNHSLESATTAVLKSDF
jgi:hypothetical protein